MKMAFEINNISKAIHPRKNDVMVYDGKHWYITTKEEIFKEMVALLNKCEKELQKTKEQNEAFKQEVNNQLHIMSELIKKLYSNKENE